MPKNFCAFIESASIQIIRSDFQDSLLATFFFLLFFIYIACSILFFTKRIDHLFWIVWASFFLVLIPASFLALSIFQVPALLFIWQAGIYGGMLATLQTIRALLGFFPRCLRRPLYYLYALFFDFFAFMTFLILYRSRALHNTARGGVGKGSIPILMIHGYKHDAGAWIFHRPQLAKEGIGPIFDISLGSSVHSIEEYAQRVKVKAEYIEGITKRSDLILVGFSMGGIVASYYALNLVPHEKIKKVITLGSPLEGTKMAMFGEGKCVEQMHYRSPFIHNLKRQISLNDSLSFCHIGSLADPIIRPSSSAWGVAGKSDKIILEDKGHLEMLYSKVITKILAKSIQSSI